LLNLRAGLERFLSRKHAAVRAAAMDVVTTDPPTDGAAVPANARPGLTRPGQEQQNRRAQRVARYEAVRRLQTAGVSSREIGRRLHLTRKTVRRFAHAASFPERQPRPPRPPLFTPYDAYLRRRWGRGLPHGHRALAEVRARLPWGLLRLRRASQTLAGPHWSTLRCAPPSPKPVSVQQASWQLLQPAETLPPDEQAYVEALQEHCPEVPRLQVAGPYLRGARP
jgi:hypothetical protein